MPHDWATQRRLMIKGLAVAGLFCLFSGCTSPTPIAQKMGPEPGRHMITITRLALSESDFSLTAFGNPREIDLYAARDGARTKVGTIRGFRGPKDVNISFEMDYDPASRYEFTIEETAIMGQAKRWNFSNNQPGVWIFSRGGPFGSGSSIAFLDEKVR